MEFYSETRKRSLKNLKESIIEIEEEIKKGESKSARYLWDVAEYLESLDNYCYWMNSIAITCHIRNPMTIEEYEELLNNVEEIISPGYIFDVERQPTPQEDYQRFKYFHNNEFIYIDFHSPSCREVKTGRMVPEVKKECSFIKES